MYEQWCPLLLLMSWCGYYLLAEKHFEEEWPLKMNQYYSVRVPPRLLFVWIPLAYDHKPDSFGDQRSSRTGGSRYSSLCRSGTSKTSSDLPPSRTESLAIKQPIGSSMRSALLSFVNLANSPFISFKAFSQRSISTWRSTTNYLLILPSLPCHYLDFQSPLLACRLQFCLNHDYGTLDFSHCFL